MTTVVKIDRILSDEEEQIFIEGRRAERHDIGRKAREFAEAAQAKRDAAERVEDKAYYEGIAETWRFAASRFGAEWL